jgi:hypothetical protein
VPAGKALSLVGGDIDVAGGRLQAEAGTVALAAAGAAGAVGLGADVAVPGGATIRLTERAAVGTTGDGGGLVRIRGGQIVVTDGSHVIADNQGGTDNIGGVVVAAKALEVSKGSRLTAGTSGPGKAGTVTVQADTIELRDTGEISSSTFGPGDAGAVMVTASRLIIVGDPSASQFTGIASSAQPDPTGNAGQVTVQADTIELRDGSQITRAVFSSVGSGVAAEAKPALGILGGDRG